MSFAITEGKNFSGEKESAKYSRIFYVIEGVLTLAFNDQTVDLQIGDAIYIEKGTDYFMKGTFKAVVINQPAFGT